VEKLRKVEKTGKPSRRDVMKSTATLVIAALWGADTAFTQEKRVTDTKKSNALPSVLS
jgi:hypothetical protein